MIFKHWVALGALLAAGSGVQAQQGSRTPAFADRADPADPAVAVPAPVYASALADHAPAAKDAGAPPDKAWRAANAAVGGQTGPAAHAGHAGHAGHRAPAPAPVSLPAPGQAAPAAAPANPHMHHRGEAEQ